ncbi:MAG: TlpA family protein disulfide reductase [Spirochaetales bacterium]|nr:TlpA family protein disulfide reductase [Spirochaetales bacterium]
MKKALWILPVLTILVFASCTGKDASGKSVDTETAEESRPQDSGGEPVKLSDIELSLNRAGFDIPADTLPSVDFELMNLKGGLEALSDYRGKVVFLNFWATWCGPCQSEMPAMENVYNELKDDGLVILAVDLAEDKDTVQAFIDERNLTFPVLLDTSGQIGAIYEARSIPTTYLIDREGSILGRAVGVRPWEDDAFMSLFRQILKL